MLDKDGADRLLAFNRLFGEHLRRVHHSAMQVLHHIHVFVFLHLLLKEAELVCDFWLTHGLKLYRNLTLWILHHLLRCLSLLIFLFFDWLIKAFEVAFSVVSSKSDCYSLGHHFALLFEESS